MAQPEAIYYCNCLRVFPNLLWNISVPIRKNLIWFQKKLTIGIMQEHGITWRLAEAITPRMYIRTLKSAEHIISAPKSPPKSIHSVGKLCLLKIISNTHFLRAQERYYCFQAIYFIGCIP